MKRKLLTGLLGIVLLSLCNAGVDAQTQVYDLEEDFTSDVSNWGFSNGATYESTNKLLQIRWPNSSVEYTKTLDAAIISGTDNKVTVELIIKTYTSGNASNYGALYFFDETGKAITGFHVRRGNPGGGNKWFIGRATSYPGTETYAYPNSEDALNVNEPTAKITFVLDFNTKKMSFLAQEGTFDYSTRVFVASGASVSSAEQDFIDTESVNIKSLASYYYRGASTSGTNGYDLMYMGVSALRDVQTANVTVKFKDQNDNEFKTEEIISDLAIGATYNATIAQKASVKDVDDYYTLDPSSPTNVEVAAGGVTLTLQFRKAPYFSAITWNGKTEANTWNEWNTSFLNESIETAYQKDAQVTFDATAEEKTVLVDEAIDLGAGNVTISESGYSFTGNGQLVGTGAININLSGEDAISLGVTNSLTGATQIAGGTVTLAKNGVLGTGIVVNGGATFVPSANDIAFPAATFNANAAIQVGNLRTSISDITIPEGVKVSVSSAYNTNNDFALGFAATGTISSGAELELNGTAAETKFGMTSASANYLANAKVTLKGTAFLYIEANQGASTTINVGTLAGEADTKLGWGRSSATDRDITWSVGALNEDSEFAGSITNVGGYRGSGDMYMGNNVHFIKAGTGMLTFSGTSSHTGNVAVNDGILNVTGSLPATAPVTVGTDATLKGTGTIDANTTVNGTLEGNLSFGGDVSLTSTAVLKITIDGSDTDAVTIAGTFTGAGTLEVIETAAPEEAATCKIIDAQTYSGSFATITLPDDEVYSFNAETGILTYTPLPTGIKVENVANEIKSIEYYDASGQKISENVHGFIIKKIVYNDGSIENRKVINN